MTPIPEEELGFLRAARQFIEDCKVKFIAVETIVVIPDAGVAGTTDFIAQFGEDVQLGDVDVSNWVVIGDWKSRGKRHAAYPEETAQLGTYSLATDMVVGKFPGRLVTMPELHGLVVVSLLDDGSYAAYPIDLEQARDTARHMIDAQWSVDHLASMGTRAIGTPLKGQAPVPEDHELRSRQLWLRRRVQALEYGEKEVMARRWPPDIPKNADILSPSEIDSIAEILGQVEAEFGAPFGEDDPAAQPTKPRRDQPASTKHTNRKQQTA